jgi:hypothetical protein
MLGTSLLDPRQIRRLALIVFAVSIVLVALDAVHWRGDQGRAALALHFRGQLCSLRNS